MVKITLYRVRRGRTMPRLCAGSKSSKLDSSKLLTDLQAYNCGCKGRGGSRNITRTPTLVVHLFGSETQEVTSCTMTKNLVSSDEMCLNSEKGYISANYKALPTKIDKKVYFNSVLNKKPVLSPNYPTAVCSQKNIFDEKK